LNKLKNTRSTLEIDLPNKLRKEFSVELTTPMTDIFNTCLSQQCFPTLWKKELITPVPKITHPKVLKDLRKISGTGDFSKVFEGFLKDWILSDISSNIDVGHCGTVWWTEGVWNRTHVSLYGRQNFETTGK
jgi:hypothetical protein